MCDGKNVELNLVTVWHWVSNVVVASGDRSFCLGEGELSYRGRQYIDQPEMALKRHLLHVSEMIYFVSRGP